MNFGTNTQHDFPKMRGGVKPRLELFRKFIRFGEGMLPLTMQNIFAYHLSPASLSHRYNKHLESTYFPWNYHLDPSHC